MDLNDTVIGVVASDVSAVSALTADGERVELDIDGGAFWWSAAEGQTIVALESVRAGERFMETMIFG